MRLFKKLCLLIASTALTLAPTHSYAASTSTVVVSDVTVKEDAGVARIGVFRSGGTGQQASVTVTQVDDTAKAGTDYTLTAGTLTFNSKDTNKFVNVPIINNNVYTGDRQFYFKITPKKNVIVNRGTATVTILEDETPPVTPPTVTWTHCADEGGRCDIIGTAQVRYGVDSSWFTKTVTDSIECSNVVFGDPAVGKLKSCETTGKVAPTSPPPPTTIACPDGSVIPSTETCPVTTNPIGGNPIPDNFDGTNGFVKVNWCGTDKVCIAPQSADDVGAFRMFCTAGDLRKDDPVVSPGKPGASHLHQFVGNTGTNAYSDTNSLRTTGGTTCGDSNTPFNRSAYWVPAMLDGTGNVVKPDFLNLYYKRVPANSPACTDPIKRRGICINLPNNIRYVFGYNMATNTNSATDPNSWEYWYIAYECWGSEDGAIGHGNASGRYHSIKQVADAGCPIGAQLVILGFAEDCWDGVNLDVPDHRSHMVYAIGEDKGYGRQCDSKHPYLIPDMQFQWHYTVDENFTKGLWRLSSDDMLSQMTGKPVEAGYTMHMDYWEAWSPEVKAIWQKYCIDGHETCAGGDLGNGTQIKGADTPAGGFPKHQLVPLTDIQATPMQMRKDINDKRNTGR